MSKIKDYVRDNNITNADIVIGSDGDQNNVTKNFTVGGLKGFMLEDFQASNQDNLTKSFYFISDSLNNKASDELVSFINSSPSFEVESTDIPLFKLIMGETLFLFTFSEIGKGNYGNGETQVTTGNLQLLSEFQLSYDILDLDPNIKVFDLGDIQSSSISGQVNNLDPEIEIEELSEGFTLFLAIQNSVYKSWIYKGSSGLFGLNAFKTSNTDFEEIKVSSNKISGLEAIDEGNGIGWRLIGRDPNNYGNIGEGAVDLSVDSGANTKKGATGKSSFAEGQNTEASGSRSHAEGNLTISSGIASHAEGSQNIASGVASHVEGQYNYARSKGEHSGGFLGTDYTASGTDTDRLVNYGNGTSTVDRSDAFTIYKNGAVRFYRDNIANINNSLKEGLFIYNTGDNNRPTIHDGNSWEGLAYKNELFDGDYNSLTNTPDLSVLNDTIVEPSLSDFPSIGENDKVYIASDTGYMYRWDGTGYTQLTDQTAIWGQISGNITDQSDLQSALSGKQDIFTQNTAFNKDFGTTADTVAEGNDSRIINGQIAFDWGNHADANYVDTFSTQDITGVKTFSSSDESLRIDAADVSGDDSVIRNASTSYNSSDSLNLLGFNPSGNLTASKPFGFGVELAWDLTDNRTYDLPDLSGTIALTSDLSDFVINSQLDNYVDRTSNQTVGGEKTFTSDVFINSDLGVGVSIPTARVDVNGDGRFRGNLTVDSQISSSSSFSNNYIFSSAGNGNASSSLENIDSVFPQVSSDVASNLLGFNSNNNLYVNLQRTFVDSFGDTVLVENSAEFNWENTTGRTYGFPDKSGTVALLDDINTSNLDLSNYVDRSTNQTIAGLKTFTQDVNMSQDLSVGSQITVGSLSNSQNPAIYAKTSNTSENILLESSDTGAGSAPDLVLYRNAGIPEDQDTLGVLEFKTNNINGNNPFVWNGIYSRVIDASQQQSALTLSAFHGSSTVMGLGVHSTSAGIGSVIINPQSDFQTPNFNLDVKGDVGVTNDITIEGDIIVPTGNVGIGTTSPISPLNIESGNSSTSYNNGVSVTKNGVIRAALTRTNSDYGRLILYDDSTNQTVKIEANGDSFFNGGDVGIGTTSPSEKLEVNGVVKIDGGKFDKILLNRGIYNAFIGLSSNESLLIFGTEGSSRLVIRGNGNVGIGTISPSEKLEVNGSLKAGGGGNPLKLRGSDSGNSNVCYISFLENNGSTRQAYIGFGAPSNSNLTIRNDVAGKNLGLLGNGVLDYNGTFQAQVKNFIIDHPLNSKKDTHRLVHVSVEAPRADLIYSGMVQLVDGIATVNIDRESNMTEGTFEALVGNVRRFCTNEGGFTRVRSSIVGNLLTVEAEDPTCTDEIFWQVIGERKDAQILESNSTDENGKLIVEPEIIVEDKGDME